MNIVKLTFEQKQLLDNELIYEGQSHIHFFTFKLEDNVWAIPEADQIACTNSNLQWLKELSAEQYVPQTTQETSGSI